MAKAKAPQKKPRKNPPQKAAKRPNQARSKARVEAILNAAETLLEKHAVEEIGPYEIAKEADVPPASVYYFFPAVEDLWAELTLNFSRRGNINILETGLHNKEVAASGWQTMFTLGLESIVNFYNEHPAPAKLILGPTTSKEIWAAFDKDNLTGAKISEKLLKKYYHLPKIPKLQLKLLTAITASEAIMRQSYRAHGHITDAAKGESLKLLISYLRTILPEELELRGTTASEETLKE